MNIFEHADKVVYGALAIATYLGTFRNNSGVPLIRNKIHGNNYGIVLGLRTEIQEGATINGVNVSGYTKNSGRINGVNLNVLASISEGQTSEVNGLEASALANIPAREKEFTTVNGVQVAVLSNTARAGKVGLAQVGLWNILDDFGYDADFAVRLSRAPKTSIGFPWIF